MNNSACARDLLVLCSNVSIWDSINLTNQQIEAPIVIILLIFSTASLLLSRFAKWKARHYDPHEIDWASYQLLPVYDYICDLKNLCILLMGVTTVVINMNAGLLCSGTEVLAYAHGIGYLDLFFVTTRTVSLTRATFDRNALVIFHLGVCDALFDSVVYAFC